MKKALAQVIYGLNIIIFVVISARALYGCYLFLSDRLLATQQGVVVALIVFSIIWFFLIRKLRKLKIQERFTDILLWGIVFAATPGVLFFLFLFLAFGVFH